MNKHIARRDFLASCAAGAIAARSAFPAKADRRIAFNTANLVAHVTGYRYELKNWGEQHKKTIAATDAAAWRSICQEIARTGFRAIEVWEAHASPEALDNAKSREWKKIMRGSGLRPVGYAGRLSPETVKICQQLDIPHIDGGLGNLNPEQATALCKSSGIRFNIENHPEKSSREILGKIGGGNDWLGVCIDTGWLGTQGVSAPDVIKECGSLIRHTHIKDVKKAGAHETCLLGEGAVNLAACMEALKSIRYAGAYSWEDEPEDRNPFDTARQNREWIARHL